MADMKTPVVYWVVQVWAALLFVGLSIPFILGKIPPNAVAGFRTAKTMSNPGVWYEANRIMGWDLLWAGSAMLADLVTTWFFRGSIPFLTITFIHVGVTLTAITAMVVHGLWRLSKL